LCSCRKAEETRARLFGSQKFAATTSGRGRKKIPQNRQVPPSLRRVRAFRARKMRHFRRGFLGIRHQNWLKVCPKTVIEFEKATRKSRHERLGGGGGRERESERERERGRLESAEPFLPLSVYIYVSIYVCKNVCVLHIHTCIDIYTCIYINK